MYGYSRCYNLANVPKKKLEWDYSYKTLNRAVMNKAIEANTNDALCWTQWSDLERKQGEVVKAEKLFLCAVEV